jgi:hypothetical protein
MADCFQQNWIGILFVAAMLAMHLGGQRRGGHSGGMHGGCAAGHPGRKNRGRAEQAGAGRPDPTRDAVNPDDDEPVRRDISGQYSQSPGRSGTERRHGGC